MTKSVRKSEEKESIYAPMYLQDIHVFAVSNLLRRPIIVLGVPEVKDVAPNFIRGVYLPLLNRPTDCIKEPILIAFHDFHFCPLVYVMNNSDTKHNLVSCGVIGDVFNSEETINEIMGEEMTSTNSGLKRTHNYIPLVYSNIESMKIHFLKPEEEKKVSNLLDEYFKTGFVRVSEDKVNEEPIHVLAAKCYTGTLFVDNSIDKYCDFLNESLKLQTKKETVIQHSKTNW